ncbi:hypothetical protein [Bacillus massiliigorillae]|uniref:hypothetical protein n=1 Tax=Bacillus massiliigorillae TaxID=1243664 RepID=UPI0003AA70B9|nr:hypothetical protein [Bacillus massiliigorillae]
MDQVQLYKHENQQVSIYICAYIKDGKLEIMGQDLGSLVEEKWGGREYEYFYSLSKEDTKKLNELLQDHLQSNESILQLVKQVFRGSECEKKFRDFCQKHGLQYHFFSC